MRSSQIVLCSEYDRATRPALLLQLTLSLIALAMLDGGALSRLCGTTFLGFWIGATLIAWDGRLARLAVTCSIGDGEVSRQ
jgi:hypothetical protein